MSELACRCVAGNDAAPVHGFECPIATGIAPAGPGVLSANDVREARYDRMPWNGEIFPETKLEIALQVLRSIATEQPGASSAVRALAATAIEVIS